MKALRQKNFIRRASAAALAAVLLLSGAPASYGATGGGSPVAAGDYHSLAVGKDGGLWAWGSNFTGRLGDGTATVYKGRDIAEDNNRTMPVKIMDGAVSVSAGFYHSLAVKTDGSLWAWGKGSFLGDGTTTDRYSPVKIMDGAAFAAAGTYHSLAIKTDGSLWAWGTNNHGMVGDGTKLDRRSPVKVMDDVSHAAVGLFHSMAVKKDGSLWAWGRNYGTTPAKLMDDISYVAAGMEHTQVIKKDGNLWAWGNNNRGQLGDGTTVNRNAPVKVMDNVSFVAAGSGHTFAIKKDGSLWAWGANNYGALGDGTTIDRSSPVKIMEGVASVAAGDSHTVAVRTDGSVWTWGLNNEGQLGDGTKTAGYKPVQIMDGTKPASGGAPTATVTEHEIKVIVNGVEVYFDQPPIIENGRTLVPLRAIFESLGAEVDWNQSTQTVTALKKDITITLKIGDNFLTKNGEKIELEVPGRIVGDRTLVPARAVAESFGADVFWAQGIRTVTITE